MIRDWDFPHFKVYKNQLPVIKQVPETAGLMLGTNKSRGCCLRTICADLLTGADLESQSLKTTPHHPVQ